MITREYFAKVSVYAKGCSGKTLTGHHFILSTKSWRKHSVSDLMDAAIKNAKSRSTYGDDPEAVIIDCLTRIR